MQNIIVFHSDGDGIISAVQAWKAIHGNNWNHAMLVNGGKLNAKCFMYDYGQNTQVITGYFDQHPEATIYVLDVRLPDTIMDKYAHRIIWIDHHESVINANKPWVPKLKHNGSKIEVELSKLQSMYSYVTVNKNQVSASDLCHMYFNDGGIMPWIVQLAARYDVWDHDEEVDQDINGMSTILFRHAQRLKSLPVGDTSIDETIADLVMALEIDEEGKELVGYMVQEGIDYNNMRRTIWKDEGQNAITFHRLLGTYDIALVNRPSVNSQYFTTTTRTKVPVFMIFHYKASEGHWSVSLYGNSYMPDASYTAKDVLQAIKATCGDKVLTAGGHLNACGCILTDIQEILQYLSPIPE